MKKRLIKIFSVFILCLVMLCGCTTPLNGVPGVNDPVTGNGGLVAQKGNYIYFVNGYKEVKNLQEGDNKGNVVNSGLYRAKVDNNGNLIYNEETGELENVEKVVSKIAGFDRVGVFIYDDYVYYATPYTRKNNVGTILFDLTEFCRVRLDGTGAEVLYTTNVASSSTKWSVASIGEGNARRIVLSVYDGSKIVSKVIGGKVSVIAEDVTSAVFPKVEEYVSGSSANEEQSYVYYTRNLKEDEGSVGNILARAHLVEAEEEILKQDGQSTYTVIDFNDTRYVKTREFAEHENPIQIQYAGTLYVTSKVAQSTEYYYQYTLYDNAAKEILNTQIAEERQLTFTSYSKILFPEFEGSISRGAVVQTLDGKIVWIKPTSNGNQYIQFGGLTGSLTLQAVKGDFAFISDSSQQLYRINIKTGDYICVLNYEEEVDGVDIATFTATTCVDLDIDNIYFFRTFKGNDDKSGVYLSRASIIDNNYNVEFLGELEENHKFVEEEEE